MKKRKQRTPKSKYYKGYFLNLCWCGYAEMRWMVYWFSDQWLATFKTLEQAKKWIDHKVLAMEAISKRTGRPCPHLIECSRNPTRGEIAFGYGATHYLDIPTEWLIKPNGKLKEWTKHKEDGLRYYR